MAAIVGKRAKDYAVVRDALLKLDVKVEEKVLPSHVLFWNLLLFLINRSFLYVSGESFSCAEVLVV